MLQTQRSKLPNGATLLLASQDQLPVVALQAWIQVGVANESPSNSGISHFIEHLVFRGTSSFTGQQISREVERHGGSLNAFTSMDTTVYHVTLPTEHLDFAFKILSEMVLFPVFGVEDIEIERQIILEELSEEDENPESALGHCLFAQAFPNDPYGQPIIGTRETVSSLKQQQINDFLREHYVFSNLIVAAAGPISMADFESLAKKHFSKSEPVTTSPLAAPAFKRFKQPSLSWALKGKEQYAIDLAFPIPGADHAQLPALDVFAHILGNSEFSRLHRRLYEDTQLARAIDCYCFCPKRAGILTIRIVLSDESFLETLKVVFGEIAKLLKEGPTEEEVRLAKRAIERDIFYEQQTVDSIAHNLAYNFLSTNDPLWDQTYLRLLERVDPDFINHVANLHVELDNFRIACLAPEGTDKSIGVNDVTNIVPEKYTQPIKETPFAQGAQLETALATHDIDGFRTVLIKEHLASELASLYISIPGGLCSETRKTNGISSLTSALFGKMTEAQTEHELAKRLEDCAAYVELVVGRSSYGVRLEAPAAYFACALDTLTDVLFANRISDTLFERERQYLLEELNAERDNHEYVTFCRMLKELFQDHPASYHSIGSEEVIENLTSSDIKGFHNSLFKNQPWSSALVAPDSHEQYLQRIADWSKFFDSETYQVSVPTFSPDTSNYQDVFLPLEADKCHVYVACTAPSIRELSLPTFDVITALLTGFGGGALYLDLREASGLAYTVTSSAYHGAYSGYFYVYVNTGPKNLSAVVNKIKTYLSELRTSPVSREELDRAKNYLIGQFLIDYQRVSTQAAHLAIHHRLKLPIDPSFHMASIQNVTAEDIQETAINHFDTDQLVVVAGGPIPSKVS